MSLCRETSIRERNKGREMGLDRIEKALKLCWLCGSCFGRGPTEPHNWRELNPDPSPNERCPSYEYFKFRTYTAMDRNSLATLMYRENYPITDDLKEIIYSCMLCGICSEICGLVDPVEINLAVREEIVEESSLLPGHELLRRRYLKYGSRYGARKESRGRWAEGLGLKNLAKETAENLLFVGCSTALLPTLRSGAIRTADLFQRAGLDFGILGSEEQCCGYVPRMLGDRRQFDETMSRNIELLNSLGIRKLITGCPGCLQTFNSYPREKLNFEVMHSSKVLADLIRSDKLKPKPVAACKVTYHDPCSLGRGCGIFDPPRNILKSIPGAELVEMDRHGRWSYCCGSGGCVGHILPDMVDFNVESRLREAERTGASVLLTACPQCYVTLQKAASRKEIRIRVEDISVFLGKSLERWEEDA